MNEINRKETAASLLKEMEATAARIRSLIVTMPPHDLLGYIYTQYMINAMADQSAPEKKLAEDGSDHLINEYQFLLEYVHAVLASDAAHTDGMFDEVQCVELFELGRKLRVQAMFFAMATSADSKDGIFGPDTADIEFRAKSNWIMVRGNRYPVLEGEFYRYVLTPHNDVLKEVYDVGAADIAEGFQAMVDAMRSGHADALTEMMKQFEAAQAFATAQDKPLEDVMGAWNAANAELSKSARRMMDDMFRGGIANVSRHTKLPPTLLADLAYRRGEETEFFGLDHRSPWRSPEVIHFCSPELTHRRHSPSGMEGAAKPSFFRSSNRTRKKCLAIVLV